MQKADLRPPDHLRCHQCINSAGRVCLTSPLIPFDRNEVGQGFGDILAAELPEDPIVSNCPDMSPPRPPRSATRFYDRQSCIPCQTRKVKCSVNTINKTITYKLSYTPGFFSNNTGHSLCLIDKLTGKPVENPRPAYHSRRGRPIKGLERNEASCSGMNDTTAETGVAVRAAVAGESEHSQEPHLSTSTSRSHRTAS